MCQSSFQTLFRLFSGSFQFSSLISVKEFQCQTLIQGRSDSLLRQSVCLIFGTVPSPVFIRIRIFASGAFVASQEKACSHDKRSLWKMLLSAKECGRIANAQLAVSVAFGVRCWNASCFWVTSRLAVGSIPAKVQTPNFNF